jgi:hypothetical protein
MSWLDVIEKIKEMGFTVVNDFNTYEDEIILHCIEKKEEEE